MTRLADVRSDFISTVKENQTVKYMAEDSQQVRVRV